MYKRQEYIIKEILTDDEELTSFLFSLGCYSGEPITVVSHLKGGCAVSIKDGRYNIAVSYTHLDVYKRQVPFSFNGRTVRRMCAWGL